MPANSTFGTFNGTTFLSTWTYANDVTNNVFGYAILGLIWVVLYITFYYATGESDKSLLGSSFLAAVTAALMSALGVVDNSVMLWPLLATIVAAFLTGKKKYG